MPTQQEEREKRFDEKFIYGKKVDKNTTEYELTTPENLKSFINEEVSLAVAQREKEIVELANQFLNAWGDEIYPANEFINLITKHNDKPNN